MNENIQKEMPEQKQAAVEKHDPNASKGRCQITGIMTTKKWKGIFICPEMLREADKIMGKTLGTTKRQALNYLKEQWNKQMVKKFQAEEQAKKDAVEKGAQ